MKNPYSKRKDGRMYKEIILGRDKKGKYKKKMLYSRKGETWRDFDKRVHEVMKDVDIGRYIKKDITLDECCDLWLKTKHHVSPKTMNSYIAMSKKIKTSMGWMDMKNITPLDIALFYNEVYETGCKSWGCGISRIFNAIFEFAKSNGFAIENVAKGVTPVYDKKRRRALTEEEENAVLLAINDIQSRHKALLALFYYTGIRRGEALALTKNDIDTTHNVITINKTIVEDESYKSVVSNQPKTENGNRKIPIPDKLLNILIPYINSTNTDELFMTRNNTYITAGNFSVMWQTILKVINKNMPNGISTHITPHYLRHNYITKLIYSGIPLKTVQYLAGHANINITLNIYTSLKYNQQEIINSVNKCFK